MSHRTASYPQVSVLLLLSIMMLSACAPTQPDTPDVPTLMVLPSATPQPPTDAAPSLQAETQQPPPQDPASVTPDLTPTPSPSPTESPSETPLVPPTPTVTASLTITPTPTRTPTPTPWPTEVEGPLIELARLALSATVVTPDFRLLTVTPTGFAPALCLPPAGGFGTALSGNPSIGLLLGCPNGAVLTYGAAVQRFERGLMIYVASVPASIYVIYDSGRWTQYPDTFVEGIDPVSGGETPPGGLFEPIRGFGKIWRGNVDVRSGLGWAVNTESGTTINILSFERGQMLGIPLYGQIAALAFTGQAQVVAGTSP